MKILAEKNNKLVLGRLSCTGESGIYIEVDEKDIPKKTLANLEKLGGAGVISGEYYRSNTADRTLYKYFKRIAPRVIFQVKNRKEIVEIEDNEHKFSVGMESIAKYLDKDIDDLRFKIEFYADRSKHEVSYIIHRYCTADEFIPLPHPLEKEPEFDIYKSFFLGRDICCISFTSKKQFSSDKEALAEVERMERQFASYDYSLEDLLLFDEIEGEFYVSAREDYYFYGGGDFSAIQFSV